MDKKEKIVVKAATWYTISNIMLRGISLFTAPIFTRLLTTAEYGMTSNFTSWFNIIFCISGLGFGTSIVRGKIEFKEDYKKYVSSIQFFGILFVAAIVAIMLPTMSFWSELMSMDKYLILIMLVYLLFFPTIGYMQTNYRFEYKYKENIFISVFNAIGNVICSIGLILMYSEYRVLGRILGMVIPVFMMGIVYMIKIFSEGRCFYNLKYWKYALQIGIPMIPHSLAMIVLGQIDRVMIMKSCGESDAGVYSFGYSYGILTSVITNALNDAIMPMIFEYIEENNKEKLNTLIKKTCNLVTILVIGVIAVGPEMLKLLGTSDYYSARWIIYPVVIGTMFQFFYQNVTRIEVYYKKTYIIAIGSVGAALVNLLLNAIFIPKYGFIAAGYTTTIGYFVLFIYHCIAARCVAGKILMENKIWLQSSVSSIFLGAILVLYYDEWMIRYAIIVIFLVVVLVLYRKDIYSIWFKLRRKNVSE